MFVSVVTAAALFAHLTFVSTALSQLVLDRQCWHEHPLSTADIISLPIQLHEIAFPLLQSGFTTSSKQNLHAPWSYPPACTSILPSLNDKLCIYTSKSFAHGRGISLFTTPSLATQFAALPAFLSPSSLSTQAINIPTNTSRTALIPGKGTGLLASQPLTFGDRITAYTPAFLAVLESELSTLDRETWWRAAIEQLPAKVKQEFLALSYVYGDERVRVQDIVKANTFQVEVGGVNHLAVWPETSRLNHACAPKYVYLSTRTVV